MKKILIILSIIFCWQSWSAQTLMISGVVMNDSGTLPGAFVFLQNSKIGVSTDEAGNFQLKVDLLVDSVVVVSMTGFETENVSLKEIKNFGEPLLIKLLSVKEGYLLNDIVIVADFKDGEAKAMNMTKISPRQVNIISAETATKLPDRNAAEAVQRIPGVVLERDQGEGRFISFRGTPSDWSSATVNGDRLPAADEESRTRAINFDILPTNLVEYVVVSKTLTPDIEGDAIGGSANFLTRYPVKKETLQVIASGGYNLQAGAPIGNASFLYGDISENKKWSFVAGASLYRRHWGTDNYQVFYGGNFNHALTRLELRDYKGIRTTIGSNFSIQYNPSPKWKFQLRGIQGSMDDNERNRKVMFNWSTGVGQSIKIQNIHNILSNRFYGGELNSTYSINENQSLSIRFASYSNSFFYGNVPFKNRNDRRNGYFVLEFEKSVQFTDFLYLDENGNETDEFNAFERFKLLDIDSPVEGYGDPYTNIQPIYRNNRPYTPTDTMYIFTRAYTETNRTWERDPVVAQVDWQLSRNEKFNFKAGMKYRYKIGQRQVGLELWDRNPAYPAPLVYDTYNPTRLEENGGFLSELGTPYDNQFMSFLSPETLEDFIPDRGDTLVHRPFGVNTPYYNQFIGSSYTYNEHQAAAYAMMDVFVSKLFSFNFGVRTEFTSTTVQADSVVENTAQFTRFLVSRQAKNEYWAILPMLNLKWKLSESSHFRGAITRSYRRPNFNELKPGAPSIDYTNFDLVVGNSLLRPSYSWNVDAIYEHFIGMSSMFSMGAYYKYVTDHIYTAFESSSTDNTGVSNEFQIPGGVISKKFQNAQYANVAGFEANVSTKFNRLKSIFKYFGVAANYSYTWSALKVEGRTKLQALPRQSPNVFNFALFFESPRLNVRVAANYKDPFLFELNLYAITDPDTDQRVVVHQDNDFDMFVGRSFSLDGSISYKLNDHFVVFAEANNLTNTPYTIYRGRPERPVKTEYYSIRAIAGIRFNL